MGTSSSSPGSPPKTPVVPPWTPDPAEPEGDRQDDSENANDGAQTDSKDADTQQPVVPPASVPIAPPGRFGSARNALGRFAHTGSTDDMRKGVGHYVRKGLSGSGVATRRFGGTARTAGSLYNALSAVSSGRAVSPDSPLDPALLQGRSADEVMNAIVEAVRPVDGTQDAEASRHAINDALSDVLNRYPDADLLNLSEQQRLFAFERYIALDIFSRFDLDVGKHLRDKAPSVAVELARLREVKSYIRETVAEAFRKARSEAQEIDFMSISKLASAVLQETFEVFEGYLP